MLPFRLIPINMPNGCWNLLGKYIVIVNHKVWSSGGKKLNVGRALGAILINHLLENRDDIEEKFSAIRSAESLNLVTNFYSADQLTAIANATSADFPNVLSVGGPDIHLPKKLGKHCLPILFDSPRRTPKPFGEKYRNLRAWYRRTSPRHVARQEEAKQRGGSPA